jgi:hypothetical protein
MRLLKAAAALLLFALFASPALADSNCSGRNSDSPLLVLSAHAAGTVTTPDLINCTTRGGIFVVDLTTVTTATVTVTIQGKDVASGKYYTLLAGAGLTGAGTTVMVVYPGAAVTTNLSANGPVPKTFRISVVIVGASAAVTGTIGASILN